MQEVKKPKKPLIFYYIVVLLILMLINFLAVPWAAQRMVQSVDYGTFMEMTEQKQIGQVQVQEQEKPDYFYGQRQYSHIQNRHDAGSGTDRAAV